MNRTIALQAGAAILWSALSVNTASAALITFDDLPGMSNTLGLSVPGPSRLTDQYLSTTGALFSSQSPFAAVVNLTSSGPAHAISNPNGIGGVNLSGGLSYAAPIQISFFDLGSGTPGVTDFVSIRGDQIAIAGTATLAAFGIDGSPLGSFTAADVNGGLTLTLAVAGIHRVVLSETSGTIAFDNLNFNSPTAAAVSEPTSLFLLGMGIAGLLARSRRRIR